MKLLLILTQIAMLSACSFKSADEGGEGTISTQSLELNKSDDSDGDFLTNEEEMNLGRNPLLADIPDLRVRFLQNYKIIGTARNLETEEIETFRIDTKIGRDNPDFKYRVGRVFIRDESYRQGAEVGRFSGHSHGEMNEHDLTWVKYPDVDPSFYLKSVLDNKKYFSEDYEIQNIKIVLESTVKLKGNGIYKSIKNFSSNFYFYDYEKESYERLDTKLVERHFSEGVNEIFEVELSNIPRKLIEDNYFKRGEFIISEINDYEIPELKSTYKKLLKSVRAKSIPVVFNNPISGKVNYVGLNGGKHRLHNVLTILFDKNFEIATNELRRIEQFENNLPDFTYLSEIADQDKKGKWFVFTSPTNKHFLDYEYGAEDFISLSYIRGSELAAQTDEIIYSYRAEAASDDEENIYPLGNITSTSKVSFQIAPLAKWGEKLNFLQDSIISRGGSCGRNCISREYKCDIKLNRFDKFNTDLVLNKEFKGELSRINLIINQEEFSLKTLVEEKKVLAIWQKGNLHIKINNIADIMEINDIEENLISLRLNTFSKTTFNGVNLFRWSGKQSYYCPMLAVNLAGHNKWPVSVISKDFSKWQRQVNWSKVKKGHQKTYHQDFSLMISSIVDNKFN